MRRLLLLPILLVLAGCGEEGIEISSKSPDYQPAKVFEQRCAGCHTLGAVGTQGSATDVQSREYKDGPNFNQRKETYDSVIYAIRNGGFSSGPMPQNIVVGKEAEQLARFLEKYSGASSKR